MTRDFFKQPGAPIPQTGDGSEAQSKAAYRLFDNDRLDLQTLLRGHVEATAQRVSAQRVVLAVQDTTTLNYTAHPATTGLGPINTKKDKGVGLVVHDTMAFDLEGTPLGLLDLQCWARDPAQAGKKELRKELPIEEKESFKWLRSYRAVAQIQALCAQTMLVSVGDRESDLHELFHEAASTNGGPKLLVRAERSRRRMVDADTDGEHELLFAKLAAQPVAGHRHIKIPGSGTREARTATLEVRHALVTLKPPRISKLKPVAAWAVYAHEVEHGPEVKEPLEWMLLTTVEVSTFQAAETVLCWYALRWGIEVFHKVLKTSCRTELRQLADADRLENCLAIDLIVAWRIHLLTKLGRETPDRPCTVHFEEDEWQVLWAHQRDEPLPEKPPTLREAVRMLGALGGFIPRKNYPDPGIVTLWRGLLRFAAMVEGYRLALRTLRKRDGP